MHNRSILVPVKRDCCSYEKYCEYIKPYLDVFGMPYEEIEAGHICSRLNEGASLILFIQNDLELPENDLKKVVQTVKDGCGLFAMSSSIPDIDEFNDFVEFFEYPKQYSGQKIIFEKEHYITGFHKQNDIINLYSELLFYQSSHLKGSDLLISLDGAPLLEISRLGKGKIALMHTADWISTDILGPVHGMDDIIRGTIIWAAKKPFVMKGMPPFVAMRVDDVWGSWESKSENPLLWVDIAKKYNLKPWLGIFTEDTNEKTAEIVKGYVENGDATAFPHAFRGCECTGPEPEEWLWYDHRHQRPWKSEIMKKRAERAKKWFDSHNIPISNVAIPHYYEISESALPILNDWKCEFVGMAVPADSFYHSGAKFKVGPYRKFNSKPAGDIRPIYYADYLSCPYNPEVDRKFFNCLVEIHDVSGYELAPTNDVEKTVTEGTLQLRRAIISGLPATLFTHETDYIRHITPENWEAEIKGITDGIKDLFPIYDTIDNIYKYVRASYNISIENPRVSEDGTFEFDVKGINDVDTKCYIFTDIEGKIVMEERTVPKQTG